VSDIRKTLISLAFFLFLFSLISNVYAATPISGCTVINSPGEYYLTQDIIDTDVSTCIVINSDNVQLDCRGYSIIAYNPSNLNFYYDTAISVNGNYVSILNCNIGAYAPFMWINGIDLGGGFSDINVSYIYVNSTNSPVYTNYNNNVRITNGYIVGGYSGLALGSYNFYVYNLTLKGLGGLYGVKLVSLSNSIISNLVISGYYYAFNLWYGTFDCQIVNNVIYNVNTAFSDWTYGYGANFIYNNIINVTNRYFYSSNFMHYWNTTLTEGTNIVGGPYIGGNYWGKSDGTGYSDTCVDANYDGICDNPYILATDNIDYLPLTRYAPAPSFSVVFNYNSVDFGTVTPNTIAEAKSINYNVSITSASDYRVSVNATDWSGATTIPANTLYFAVNDTLDKLSFSTAKQLSNAVQQVAIFPSSVTTNYHAFYFAVPVVPIGTYTATITITYEVV